MCKSLKSPKLTKCKCMTKLFLHGKLAKWWYVTNRFWFSFGWKHCIYSCSENIQPFCLKLCKGQTDRALIFIFGALYKTFQNVHKLSFTSGYLFKRQKVKKQMLIFTGTLRSPSLDFHVNPCFSRSCPAARTGCRAAFHPVFALDSRAEPRTKEAPLTAAPLTYSFFSPLFYLPVVAVFVQWATCVLWKAWFSSCSASLNGSGFVKCGPVVPNSVQRHKFTR